MVATLQTTFSNAFASMKMFQLDQTLTEVGSQGSKVGIGSGNVLATYRQHSSNKANGFLTHMSDEWPSVLRDTA